MISQPDYVTSSQETMIIWNQPYLSTTQTDEIIECVFNAVMKNKWKIVRIILRKLGLIMSSILMGQLYSDSFCSEVWKDPGGEFFSRVIIGGTSRVYK